MAIGLVQSDVNDPCFYHLLQMAAANELLMAKAYCEAYPVGNAKKIKVLTLLLNGGTAKPKRP